MNCCFSPNECESTVIIRNAPVLRPAWPVCHALELRAFRAFRRSATTRFHFPVHLNSDGCCAFDVSDGKCHPRMSGMGEMYQNRANDLTRFGPAFGITLSPKRGYGLRQSHQFLDWASIVFDQILRSPREIRKRHAWLHSQVVIQGGE